MKRKIYKILLIIKVIIQSIFYRKSIFIWNTFLWEYRWSCYIISRKKFLQDNFKSFKVIEVEISIVNKLKNILPKFCKSNLIFIQRGGYLGSLWKTGENMLWDNNKSVS